MSATSVLSVGAGSFCDFRGVDPLPPRPLDPRPPPLPPLCDLGFGGVVLVLVVATEADIVRGGLSELEERVALAEINPPATRSRGSEADQNESPPSKGDNS